MQTLRASFVLVLRETHFSLSVLLPASLFTLSTTFPDLAQLCLRREDCKVGEDSATLRFSCLCQSDVSVSVLFSFTVLLLVSAQVFFMGPLVVGHDFMWRHLQITIHINALFVGRHGRRRGVKFTLQMSGVKCEWQWRKSKDPNLCAGQGVRSRLYLSNLIYFGIQNLRALCHLIPCSLISALYTQRLLLTSSNLIKFCIQ